MKDNATFYFAGHCVKVIHLTAGRMRLKAIAPTDVFFKHLTADLARLDGVYAVESKLATGSIIIWFNSYRSGGKEIIAELVRSPELHAPSISTEKQPSPTEKPKSLPTLSNHVMTGEYPAVGVVKTGILKGLKGGVLRGCLAIFARYSLEELAQHSGQEELIKNEPSPLPKPSVWQRLKAIAR